jgi:hypothetical protein
MMLPAAWWWIVALSALSALAAARGLARLAAPPPLDLAEAFPALATTLDDLSSGRRVSVQGHILPQRDTFRSPVVGQTCVAWEVAHRDDYERTTYSRRALPFVLRTPGGDVRIELELSWRVTTGPTIEWDALALSDDPPSSRRRRAHLRAHRSWEQTLCPGDEITIAGVFAPATAPPGVWEEPVSCPRMVVRACPRIPVTIAHGRMAA